MGEVMKIYYSVRHDAVRGLCSHLPLSHGFRILIDFKKAGAGKSKAHFPIKNCRFFKNQKRIRKNTTST